MRVFRVEVIGTWDVEAESEEEAIEKIAMLLPPRNHHEVDMGIEQSDVKIGVLREVEDEVQN